MKAYPNWFYPLLLIILFALLTTGLLLIPNTLTMRFEWDVLWQLSGGNRLAAVAIHTLSSYVILMMMGALSTIHMRAGIRSQKNQRSGFSLIAIFFTLTLTGLGLFYLANNTLILLASTLHIMAGAALAAVFTLHFVKIK
ncbi:MAG: heme A synthase [Methylophagaceae bacterium]|jgi:heme A synthase